MSGPAAKPAPLQGRCVWVTRPAAQMHALQQQLQQLGATVLCLPLLVIEPVPLAEIAKQRLMNLDHYDLVFYVSSNAATLGLDAIFTYWPQYPHQLHNFAVGPGTAAVLQSHGLDVAFPTERMSSEAMLALPQLQDIRGKQALIVRGVGGREILAEGLLARGASVDYAELYLRKRPEYDDGQLRGYCEQLSPQAVVISSAEALDNLHFFYAPLGQWPQLPLYVSSDRLAQQAHKLGNNTAMVMAGASDVAIITALLAHLTNQQS